MYGIHRRTSLMSSLLLLQQCLAYLVRLTRMVCVMGVSGRTGIASRICSKQHAGILSNSHLEFSLWALKFQSCKFGDRSQGRPEGSLFNGYNTEV